MNKIGETIFVHHLNIESRSQVEKFVRNHPHIRGTSGWREPLSKKELATVTQLIGQFFPELV